MVTRIEAESETTLEPEPSRIDLNRADAASLRSLPGIGPKLAARILDYRDKHGPFLFEEDITQVSGIGPDVYEELADRLTVSIPTADELAGLAGTHEHITDDVIAPIAATETAEPPSILEEIAANKREEHPLAVAALTPITYAQDTPDESWEIDMEQEPEAPPIEHAAIPMPGPVAEETRPAKPDPTPQRGGRFAWFWTALLGAVLGGFLGLGLSMLVFAGINGSVDVNRSTAMRRVNGQVNELSVKLDAVQGDVGILQGDVSGLRQRVEVLSGLTARMEQAEETLATFTKEIQALEEETSNLTTSLADLSKNVDTMSDTLDAVKVQTDKATTFFGRLQELLREIFVGQPVEPESMTPQGASPQIVTSDPEVDA